MHTASTDDCDFGWEPISTVGEETASTDDDNNLQTRNDNMQ